MTIEEAKKELNSCRYKLLEAQGMAELVAKLYRDIVAPVKEIISVNKSKSTAPDDRIDDYIETKTKYEALRDEAYTSALLILEKINCLDNPYKDILRMKYVEVKKFEEIAVEIGYCYRQVKRKHKEAIVKYSNLQEGD